MIARERRLICKHYNGTVVEPTSDRGESSSDEDDDNDSSLGDAEQQEGDGVEEGSANASSGAEQAPHSGSGSRRGEAAGSSMDTGADEDESEDEIVDEVLPCTVDTCQIPRDYGVNDSGDTKSAIVVAAGGGSKKSKDGVGASSGNSGCVEDAGKKPMGKSKKNKINNKIVISTGSDDEGDGDEENASLSIRHVNGKMVEMYLLQSEEKSELAAALEKRSSDLVPQTYEGFQRI